MIFSEHDRCPKCGGKLHKYDRVQRLVRLQHPKKRRVYIFRYKCRKCASVHRLIPSIIFPRKRYHSLIIKGVLENKISSHNLIFEDYPTEATIRRWKCSHKNKLLL